MNVIIDLGAFIDSKVQGYSFRTPKLYKVTKQAFFVQETCRDMCGTVGVWITVSL